MNRVGVFTVLSGSRGRARAAVPKGAIVTFGRSPDCTYSFDDASLSREHAHVVRIASDYVLKDTGSTNGTFVNDPRARGPCTLKDGDRVQLGLHTMLRFALVSESEEEALRRVYEAAIKDGLTGVCNRKHLDERLTTELAYGARHGTPLSVVIFDVDYFKKVNDTHGHLAGDAVLKVVASILGAERSAPRTWSRATAARSSCCCCAARRRRRRCHVADRLGKTVRRHADRRRYRPRSTSPRAPASSCTSEFRVRPTARRCSAPPMGGSTARRTRAETG